MFLLEAVCNITTNQLIRQNIHVATTVEKIKVSIFCSCSGIILVILPNEAIFNTTPGGDVSTTHDVSRDLIDDNFQ